MIMGSSIVASIGVPDVVSSYLESQQMSVSRQSEPCKQAKKVSSSDVKLSAEKRGVALIN